MPAQLLKTNSEEREIIIGLSNAFRCPTSKRAKKALNLIKRAVMKRYDVFEVKIDPDLNSAIWAHSTSKPPRRINIKVKIEDDVAYVQLG